MGRKKTLDLVFFQEAARKNGGECLAEKYEGLRQKLRFRCREDHVFETTGAVIQRGSWCRRCAEKKKKLLPQVVFQEIAETRGGKYLAENDKGGRRYIRFSCELGHIFEAPVDRIRKGHWCKKCANEKQRLSLDFFREVALSHGGELISKEYRTISDKLIFRCESGHIFETPSWNVRYGTWCPECSAGRGEREAIGFVQRQSGLTFKKERPGWLRYKKGHPLELDGLSLEAGLALEYQGKQHYEHVQHFQETETDFHYQQEKDKWKAEQTAKRGVLMLAIPASTKADQASVQAAVTQSAEVACFPLFGVNREFTEMVRGMYPSAAFSDLILFSAFSLYCGEV